MNAGLAGLKDSELLLRTIGSCPAETQNRLFSFLQASSIFPFGMSDFDYSSLYSPASQHSEVHDKARSAAVSTPIEIYAHCNGFTFSEHVKINSFGDLNGWIVEHMQHAG